MVIDMNETRLCALEQLKAFLEGTTDVGFQPAGDDAGRYAHLQAVLKRFGYPPPFFEGFLIQLLDLVLVKVCVPLHRDRGFRSIVITDSEGW
ncbi:MAG: hypothetical protein ACREWG_09670 [Gammaproteobacteria bacterium]